jgi:hypothetical protein
MFLSLVMSPDRKALSRELSPFKIVEIHSVEQLMMPLK